MIFSTAGLCELSQVYELFKGFCMAEDVGEIVGKFAISIRLVVVFFEIVLSDYKVILSAEGFHCLDMRQ